MVLLVSLIIAPHPWLQPKIMYDDTRNKVLEEEVCKKQFKIPNFEG